MRTLIDAVAGAIGRTDTPNLLIFLLAALVALFGLGVVRIFEALFGAVAKMTRGAPPGLAQEIAEAVEDYTDRKAVVSPPAAEPAAPEAARADDVERAPLRDITPGSIAQADLNLRAGAQPGEVKA